VATIYEMIHAGAGDTMTVHSVFAIGPDKKIKATLNYPASTGRNFDEILRVIDSLQLTAKFQAATAVNRKQGEDVIIVPAVSDEAAIGHPPAVDRHCRRCKSADRQIKCDVPLVILQRSESEARLSHNLHAHVQCLGSIFPLLPIERRPFAEIW
jgi:hypothetical protein